MINNFSSKKIQIDLFNLTGKNYTIKYINHSIKVIFEKIILSKKTKFMISGPQGCGKTTLLKLISKNFIEFYGIKPLCISLDDYYLTKKQRVKISNKIHPLLITRGVPGTHDIKKLLKTIELFDKKKYPIKLIKFDKLKDDRKKKTTIIKPKKNIIVLEGWCCGCSKINNNYLKKNINKIEKSDKNLLWRKYYNEKLNTEYKMLFNKFEYLIYYKITNFKYVLDWRLKQELQLSLKKNITIKFMSKENIKNFILYYEKITKWMMKKTSPKASLVIKIDKDQIIKNIIN